MGMLSEILQRLTASPDDGATLAMDALVLAIACDEEVTDEELDYAGLIARQIPSLANVSDDELGAHVDAAFQRLEAAGWEGHLATVAAAARQSKSEAEVLRLSIAVQYADGDVSETEDAFIDHLAAALGIDDDRVQDIIDDVERQLGIPPDADAGAAPAPTAALPHECRQCGAPVKASFRGNACPFCDARLA